MNKGILGLALVLGLMIIGGAISTEAKGISLKDYTDPYNRYSIQYPSKWQIQSEPVHTENNYLYEVPFIVGNNKGSTISVYETVKDEGLSPREYASFIQNNVPVITTKVLNPVTCTSETICFYYYAVTMGLGEVYNMNTFYSGAGNKVFTVSASFGSYEPMDTKQFSDIEDSFRLLQDAAVTKSNNYATITKNG